MKGTRRSISSICSSSHEFTPKKTLDGNPYSFLMMKRAVLKTIAAEGGSSTQNRQHARTPLECMQNTRERLGWPAAYQWAGTQAIGPARTLHTPGKFLVPWHGSTTKMTLKSMITLIASISTILQLASARENKRDFVIVIRGRSALDLSGTIRGHLCSGSSAVQCFRSGVQSRRSTGQRYFDSASRSRMSCQSAPSSCCAGGSGMACGRTWRYVGECGGSGGGLRTKAE